MLFVKNLVFLDGAIATLAPDLDLFGEIGAVSMHFATTHGERLAGELGLDPAAYELDLSGVKASFGYEDVGRRARSPTATCRSAGEVIRSRLQKRKR